MLVQKQEQKMIYHRQLKSRVENKEKITEECITKCLFLKWQKIGTLLFKEEIMNHAGFSFEKDPGAHFVRAAEKQLHEPFANQTQGTVHLSQLYVKPTWMYDCKSKKKVRCF